MTRKKIKIAITGAAGQIGYALLFRVASGELFGEDTDVELSLLELDPALPALKGVVMELEDCAFPLLGAVSLSSDPFLAFRDADWAILVGAVPRKAGMERGDLLKINAGVFLEQGKALARNAKKTCKVLVVGNPCNTNAFIVKESARGSIDPRNVFAMMMLDQKRAVAQLADKAGVAVSAVRRMGIWGNHSATQFPDFYHATIDGRPVQEAITDERWLRGEFIFKVQRRGADIIQARGFSSAASAANAVMETVRSLNEPTAAGDFFSVAVVSDGGYGIPEGLVCGVPVYFDGKNWKVVGEIGHGDFAREKISDSLKELIQERDQVAGLLCQSRYD